ncbi:MAG: hypothetical protein U0325_17260 [Polyangiales bacterium]
MMQWSALADRWGPRLGQYLNRNLAPGVSDAIAHLRRTDPNIVGFGFGPKRTAGALTDAAAVVVFVRRKEPRAALVQQTIVPDTLAGIATDVREVGVIVTRQASYYPRPVPWGAGIEVSDELMSDAGTLGALVHDEAGAPLLLSNAHVLAPSEDAAGVGVYQGLNLDAYKIAEVDRWVQLKCVPTTNFSVEPPASDWNFVDAALARALPDADLTQFVQANAPAPNVVRWWRPLSLVRAGLPLRYFGFPREGLPRDGAVVAIAARLWVHIPVGKQAYFVDQIVMDGAPTQGDSGSLAFAPDGSGDWSNAAAVGLVFAGSVEPPLSASQPLEDPITLLNPIESVFNALEVKAWQRWPPFEHLAAQPWLPKHDWRKYLRSFMLRPLPE